MVKTPQIEIPLKPHSCAKNHLSSEKLTLIYLPFSFCSSEFFEKKVINHISHVNNLLDTYEGIYPGENATFAGKQKMLQPITPVLDQFDNLATSDPMY